MALPSIKVDIEVEGGKEAVSELNRVGDAVDDVGEGVVRTSHRMDKMRGAMRMAARGAGLFAAAATAVSAGAFKMTASVTAQGDAIAKTADRLGIGVEALQELQFAAERTGVSNQTLNMALQRMTRRVSEAAQGSGEAVKAIKELGLSAESLAQMSPEQQMAVFADALEKVGNQGDKTRLAMKLFDSEGVALLNTLSGGSAALNGYAEEVRGLGGVLSEDSVRASEKFQDQLTNLQAAFGGIKNELAAELIPVFVDELLPVIMNDIIPAFKEFIPVIASVVSNFSSFIGHVANGARIVGEAFEAIKIKFMEVFGADGFIATLPERMAEIGANIMEGLKLGLLERFEAVKESIMSPFNWLKDTVKSTFGINSPSTVFKEIGGFLMKGLEIGINERAGGALAAAGSVVGNLTKVFEGSKKLSIAQAVVDGITSAVAAWRQGMQQGGPLLAAAYTAASLARTGAMIKQLKSSGTSSTSQNGAASGGQSGQTIAASASEPAQRQVSLTLIGNAFSAEQVAEAVGAATENGTLTVRGA